MGDDESDRVPEGDAAEDREAASEAVRGSSALPDGTDTDSISIGHELGEGSGVSDSSSEIRIGTGRSGMGGQEWALPGELRDSLADHQDDHHERDPEGGPHEPPSVGSFELPEGLVAADQEPDFGSVDVSASDDQGVGADDGEDLGSEFSAFADIDNPDMAADLIGETSQDELPGSWDDSDGGAELGGAMAEQASEEAFAHVDRRREVVRSGLRPRPPRRKEAAGSIFGVIVGGMLAVPIVLLILLWGFRRDDFGIARVLPPSLEMLLPAELRAPVLPAEPTDDSLPTLPKDGFMADVDASPARDEAPVTDDATSAADSASRLPEDPLLDAADLALLEMATARAAVMLTNVLEVPDDAPDDMRKRALVDWYKSLAAVGEKAALAEQVISDAGRSTEAVGRPLATMVDQIIEMPRVSEELAALARQWMQATKRDAEGAVFPGTLTSVRRVGDAWVSTVRSEDELSAALTVTALSRQRPTMPEGSSVVAVGVVVANDTMWVVSWVASEPEDDGEPGVSPLTGE